MLISLQTRKPRRRQLSGKRRCRRSGDNDEEINRHFAAARACEPRTCFRKIASGRQGHFRKPMLYDVKAGLTAPPSPFSTMVTSSGRSPVGTASYVSPGVTISPKPLCKGEGYQDTVRKSFMLFLTTALSLVLPGASRQADMRP